MSRPATSSSCGPLPGFVDEQLRAELPGLRLDWVTVAGARRASPPEVDRSAAPAV